MRAPPARKRGGASSPGDRHRALLGPTVPPLCRAVVTRVGWQEGRDTAAESGLPGFIATYWNGVPAPAATPASIVAKLNATVNEGLRSPEMQGAIPDLAAEVRSVAIAGIAALGPGLVKPKFNLPDDKHSVAPPMGAVPADQFGT